MPLPPPEAFTLDLGRPLNAAEKDLLNDCLREYHRLEKLATQSDADEQSKLGHIASWEAIRTDVETDAHRMWQDQTVNGAWLRMGNWEGTARSFRKGVEREQLLRAVGALTAPGS